MNRNCCATSVPPPGSFKVLAKAVGVWQERLPAGLSRGIEASDQTMGHLERRFFSKRGNYRGRYWPSRRRTKLTQCPRCVRCAGVN
jgi:hypothetical protein